MNERSSTLIVNSYAVELMLDPLLANAFRCRTTIRFSSDNATARADLRSSVVESATLNGLPLDISQVWDGSTLRLTGLGSANVLEVEGLFPYSVDDRGVRRATDQDGTVYVYNVNSPAATSRAFCCFDDHDLRARVDLRVSVPAGWTALVSDTSSPLAPYLAVFAAGPWSRLYQGSLSCAGVLVPLAVYAQRSRAGGLDRARHIADLVARSVAFYEHLLGVPYPYQKCDAVFVRDLPQLALSVPGLIVFADAVFDPAETAGYQYDLTVISHEIAHAWIGCLVDSGVDSWLIEACATYLARTAVHSLISGSQPWDDPDAPDAYYAPDADLIRDVEGAIGRDNVLRGLGLFCRRFAHRNAGRAELTACWSEVSGIDVTGWAATRGRRAVR